MWASLMDLVVVFMPFYFVGRGCLNIFEMSKPILKELQHNADRLWYDK
jgi:hypothetical protein